MKVGIKDKSADKVVTGEMVGVGETGTLVGEMITDAAKLADFGFPQEVVDKGHRLSSSAGDDKPEFAVVRVEEGWSGSRRLWPAREIDSIVKQTNEQMPVGHLGHIPDDKESTAFPEPQTTWFGALAKSEPSKQTDRVGEMVRVAYFAGYNLPGAKIRTYIKAAAVRGISWWGRADQVPIPGKGVEVRNFDLKALDWARKLAEGMPTSSVVATTGEMNGGTKVDKELSQVTPEEFKKENPNGYQLLVTEAQAEMKTTLGEMEQNVEAAKKDTETVSELRKLLKLDENADVLGNIASLMKRLGDKAKAVVKDEVAKLLEEKFPGEENEDRRKLALRLMPVAEMESKVAEESDEETAKKTIGEMVNTQIDKDDELKKLLGEQQPPVIRRREELRGNADGDMKGNSYVGEMSRVTNV